MRKLAPWNDTEVRWVCEQHPDKESDHKVWSWWRLRYVWCGGPGMPEDTPENRAKGYIG